MLLYSNVSPGSYRFKFSAQLGETRDKCLPYCPNQDPSAFQLFPRKHEDHFLCKPSALLVSYVNPPKAKIALFVTKDNRNGHGIRGSGKEEMTKKKVRC